MVQIEVTATSAWSEVVQNEVQYIIIMDHGPDIQKVHVHIHKVGIVADPTIFGKLTHRAIQIRLSARKILTLG